MLRKAPAHLIRLLAIMFALVAGLTTSAFAEGTAEPGPHAANFKLLNNGSGIDQYTGSFSWQRTLLTVPGRGGLDFPITLTYNGGIGVEQEASWVGLGFGLNLGSIERSVVYIPDDMVLYHKYGTAIHQHDGWLFDDNYEVLPDVHSGIKDSQFTDGPDMWTVALSELGANMSIFADSTNIFRQAGVPYGPAGKDDRANMLSASAPWASKYQRSFGVAVRLGGTNYNPDSLSTATNNERQRHCYVSPPMGSTVQGRTYNYSGEIKLIFNDSTNGYGNNTGACSVYVYKYASATSSWSKNGPFLVKADSSGWKATGVSVTTNDRFAILCKSRKFEFEKWQPVRVDYEVEFSDWGGYYLNPESYSDPYNVLHQGFTPRISSFSLTGAGGKSYVFGTSDWVRATSRKPEFDPQLNNFIEDSTSICFNSSYKLTSILSSDYVDSDGNGVPSAPDLGSWVRISYDSAVVVNYANKSLKAHHAVFHRFGSVSDNSPVWQWHHVRYPLFIETPTHKAYFFLSPRLDNWGVVGLDSDSSKRPKQLDSLVLFAKTPSGEVRERRIAWRFANVQTEPTSFANWLDGQTLGWHTTPEGSVGKLTLLEVKEFACHDGDSLPGIRFKYTINPEYTEQLTFGDRNDNVDFYYPMDQFGDKSYYAGGYYENWGYYRSSLTAKPGQDQQAWSLSEIVLPEGSKESVEWESNRYLWANYVPNTPAGGTLNYRFNSVNNTLEDGGIERGGVRVRKRKLDGGMQSDSTYDYLYGEGIACRPQTPARKATRTGFIGNSQEVGYRSVSEHLAGDSADQRVLTFFTNGSSNTSTKADGIYPSPDVDETNEARRDKGEGSPSHYILEGVKRGLPYRQVLFNSDGDSIHVRDQLSDYVLKASKDVDLGWAGVELNFADGRARSIWVRQTETRTRQFDENGANSVLFITKYEYDSINGMVTTQTDSLGNGIARKNVTEYLHTQQTDLDSLLKRRNILDLVYKQEVQKVGGGNVVESKSMFDYKDFGNGRVYPWHRYDYRKISPAEVETTTYAAYDKYGYPRLVIDPTGTKTAYVSGYSGTRNIVAAPNADTGEVAYTGLEDSLTADGWLAQNGVHSTTRPYSGKYSSRVIGPGGGNASYGPNKVLPHSGLISGRRYVFSAWVYAKADARLSVDIVGWGSAPDYSSTTDGELGLNEWIRLEVVFQYPANAASGIDCYTAVGSDTTYFDDLRIQPVDCPMQTFVYDRATMQLEAVFDANNIAAERYYYDGFGRLSKILDPNGNKTARFEYAHSRVGNSAFDPKNPNSVKEIRYRSSTTGDSNVTVTFFDGLGREVQRQVAINSNARIVSAVKYNGAGLLVAQTKPAEKSGALGSMTYDTLHLPSTWNAGSQLNSGDLHAYYDGDGPGANCHGYPYMQPSYSADPLRRIKETGQPDTTWKIGSGNTIQNNYLSNNSADVTGWHARTLTKAKTIDEGNLVTFQYTDRLGRIVQSQIDSGFAGFNDTLPPFGASDTAWIKTRFAYDIRGNRVQSIRQLGETGRDTSSFAYDALGRLTYEKSPDAGLVRHLYDKDGNLRFSMDAARNALNKFIYYKYDALNRKTEEGLYTDTSAFTQANADNMAFPTSGGSAQFVFRYDSTGTSGGSTVFPSYGRGRLSSWNAGAYHRRLAYDQLGRVVSENIRIDSSTTISYSYDWQGNLKTLYTSTKAVLPQVHYKYDMANRLIGVGTSTAAFRYDSLLYWPWGGLKTQVLKTTSSAVGQTVDYTYNSRDWLLRINDTSSVVSGTTGSSDHFALHLGYGKLFNGDIDSIQFKHSGQSVSWEKMTYDTMRRLSRWHPGTASDTTGDEIYNYDWAGNVLYWKLGDTTAGFSHTYWPGTNRLKKIGSSADYTYDASGHLASEPGRSFSTEYRNIASSVTFPKANWNNYLSFAYDADLQRIKKVYDVGYTCECVPQESIAPEDPHDLKSVRLGAGTLSAAASGQGVADRRAPLNPEVVEDSPVQMNAGPGGECICRSLTTTQYVHTHDGRVVREYVNGVVQRDFLYAGSSRIGVSEKSGSNYNLKYFLTDHLGSTRQVIDSSGLVESRLDYYPYGNVRSSLLNYNTKVRYTGKVFDDEEVEQTYYGARYLNGVTQRFNSVDPLQHKYPGWSPYVYGLANPIKNYDVDGRFVGPIVLAGALMAAGFVATTPDVANAPSAPSADGEIPEPARVFMDEVKDFGLEAVGGAVGLGAGYLAAKGVKWIAVKIAAKFTDDAVEVASESASRSFGSFSSFKRAMGSAGEGRQWHHIVEQTPGNVERFGAQAIHSTTNVVSVSSEVNQSLNGLYSSIRPEITGSTSMTVRQWLSSQPYDAVKAFGHEALKQVQSGVWP